MKRIELTQGQYAIVDDEDYEALMKYKWHAKFNKCNGGYYAVRSIKPSKEFIHRVVMNCPADMIVDHINHNSLDNRKSNLRIVTKSQNQMNRRKMVSNTSGVIGVRWHKRDMRWRASITALGRDMELGSFKSIEDATQCRRNAELKYYGKYSYSESVKLYPPNKVLLTP